MYKRLWESRIEATLKKAREHTALTLTLTLTLNLTLNLTLTLGERGQGSQRDFGGDDGPLGPRRLGYAGRPQPRGGEEGGIHIPFGAVCGGGTATYGVYIRTANSVCGVHKDPGF